MTRKSNDWSGPPRQVRMRGDRRLAGGCTLNGRCALLCVSENS